MTDWAPLEVAIGLVLVFFILSVIASSLNEAIATVLGWRAKYLERWLENILKDPPSNQQVRTSVDELFSNPLLASLIPQPGVWRSKTANRAPSYIATEVFSAAVLTHRGTRQLPATVADAIDNLPSRQLQEVARRLSNEASDTIEDLRANLERWYDDSMERVSGWYKRRVQFVLALIGLVLAIVLNADTMQIVGKLWSDQSVRAAVVAEADRVAQSDDPAADLEAVADRVDQLKSLDVPLGWKLEEGDPRDLPDGLRGWAGKVVGILLTALALMLGAPFWFDLLSRFARLRISGAPPPPRDGIRTGEGELRRAGPTSA
jgi:hypothetical protein